MKLTKEQRKEERQKLEDRLRQALEETARGVTDGEVRESVLRVCCELNLVK